MPTKGFRAEDPWSRIPRVREGILTQVKSDRSVVVIDPQDRRAFVFKGKIAQLWLMMEEGRSSTLIERTLNRGLGAARRKNLAIEVVSFFDDIVSLKLALPAKRARPRSPRRKAAR